jgi:hypothetical protein
MSGTSARENPHIHATPWPAQVLKGRFTNTVKLDLAALKQEHGFSVRRFWLSRVFSRLSL